MLSNTVLVAILGTIGIGSIIVALLNRYWEKQKQNNEHDLEIFNRSDEILSEEKLLHIINDSLWGGHSIGSDDRLALNEWCSFFDKEGNQYLDIKISQENQSLFKDLNQLINFINANFSSIRLQSPNNLKIYLQPDLNVDFGNASMEDTYKYDKFVEKLNALIENVNSQYLIYRRTIKQSLKK